MEEEILVPVDEYIKANNARGYPEYNPFTDYEDMDAIDTPPFVYTAPKYRQNKVKKIKSETTLKQKIEGGLSKIVYSFSPDGNWYVYCSDQDMQSDGFWIEICNKEGELLLKFYYVYENDLPKMYKWCKGELAKKIRQR